MQHYVYLGLPVFKCESQRNSYSGFEEFPTMAVGTKSNGN
jgi:hypothetical protein